MTEKKSPPQPDPWGRIYRCGWVALGKGAFGGNTFGQIALSRGFMLMDASGIKCFWAVVLAIFLKMRGRLSTLPPPFAPLPDFQTFHFWDSCVDSIDVFGLLLPSLFSVTLAFSVVGTWRLQLGRELILWKERCCPVRKLPFCWPSVLRRCFFFFLLATVRRKLLLLTFLLRLTLLSYFHS